MRLETQRKRLTIFFSDIKGFTELSEEMEPEGLTELLNNYFNEMSQIALKYGGTIDRNFTVAEMQEELGEYFSFTFVAI